MPKLKPFREYDEKDVLNFFSIPSTKPKIKVLITGGAGYIGTVLVEQLLAQANTLDIQKITVLDNLLYKQDGLFPLLTNPKLEFVYGDVRNTELLNKLVEESNVVIPLAALVGMPACNRHPQTAEEVNQNHVEQICDLIKWRKLDVKVIYPNTNSLYGTTDGLQMITEDSPAHPISVYGITKYEAEKAVLEIGGIAFRLATVFGTSYRFRKDLLVNDFVLKAVTDKYVVLFESHFKRNYIHVRDVVDAFILMIQNYENYKGQVFNVGLSSANLSKLELCEAIKRQVPDFVIKQDEFAKDFDKRNYIVSNEKLEATGWKPKRDLDFGIKELIKAYEVLKNSNTKYTNL